MILHCIFTKHNIRSIFLMSVQHQNIFQEKARLREEHEHCLEKEKALRALLLQGAETKKKSIQTCERSIMQKSQHAKRCLEETQTIEKERKSTKKELQKILDSQEQKKKEFDSLTVQSRAISREISELSKEVASLNQKYKVNESHESTPETNADLEKIRTHSLRIQQLSTQLTQTKKKIDENAAFIESCTKDKKTKLNRIKESVQKEEEKIGEIKKINEQIKQLKSQAQKINQEIQNELILIANMEQEHARAARMREDRISYLPYPQKDETIFISNEGLKKMLDNFDPKCPEKGFYWTSDYRTELPIFVKQAGIGSLTPTTFTTVWRDLIKKYAERPALTFQISEDVWKTLNYKQYYDENCRFGRSLIAHGITEFTPIMIVGFNSAEWMIAYSGSILARYVPVGLYTTNNAQTCQYIANHCEGQLVVLEDLLQLKKYYQIVDRCPKIKYFVMYKGQVPADLPAAFRGRVFTWQEFMKKGDNYEPKSVEETLEYRQNIQKPGECMTFIYTSGTTGMPKAVMISHDNFIKVCESTFLNFPDAKYLKGNGRILSYLPLGHAAGQLVDIMLPCIAGQQVFFSHPSALQGNMLKYLLVSRPTGFLGVPRIWEKLEEKLAQTIASATGIKKKLLDWVMSIGTEGTFAQIHNKPTPRGWFIAKRLFDKIKSSLGFSECEFFITGAAPMRESTRNFYLKINFSFLNVYGMSQTSGPHTVTDPFLWTEVSEDYLKEAGVPQSSLEVAIQGQDKEGKGEICMRGRNRFMGYFKNDDETCKAIDRKGFVHSGDEGRIDSRGILYITGRIKELIVTAGGENIPPVLIENEIVKALSIVSQVVVIGDMRKYLSCLICLKLKDPNNPKELAEEVIEVLKKQGSNAKTIQQAILCPKVSEIIKRGLEQANKKAISNAQRVQRHTILPVELTIDLGVLTPTLKLKRKVVHEMFKKEIESMYIDSKL